MKFLGLISILISSILVGLYIRSVFKKRVESLEQTVNMIDLIESQLSYINTDVYVLLELLAHHRGLNQLSFLSDCLTRMSDGEDFDASWQESLQGFVSPLNREDKDILCSFGYQLGKSDLQGQISNCKLHRERLSSQLLQARQSFSKYGNLSLRLPFLCGILLIIILI